MLKTSESVKEIFSALVKFNNTFKGLTKDATNPFFKNNYISFDSIVGLRNELAAAGLVMIQSVGGPEEGTHATITTTIAHSSGEWIESDALTVKPVKNDPQGLGSAISYGKRYQAAAMLGIAEVTDDDGNKASDVSNTQKATDRKNNATNQKANQAPTPAPSNAGMTEEQMHKMSSAIKNNGLTREKAIAICKEVTGKESAAQLTSQEAEKVILAYQMYKA